jgi:uncharacterized protein YukE
MVDVGNWSNQQGQLDIVFQLWQKRYKGGQPNIRFQENQQGLYNQMEWIDRRLHQVGKL